MKARKTYTFRRNPFYRGVALELGDGMFAPEIELTDATYNRFVRLANSGNYAVEILDADYGVAWQMQRKAA